MPPQGPRDLSHGFLLPFERPNGVSFFTGDLVIRQRSLPSFSRVKETTVSQITSCRTYYVNSRNIIAAGVGDSTHIGALQNRRRRKSE